MRPVSVRSTLKHAAPDPGVRTLPVGPARGLRLHIDFARQTRLYLGLYETELLGHLARFAARAQLTFDVGSNVGYDALLLAKQTAGRVVAFEADPGVMAELDANIAANPDLAGAVAVVRGMVGRAGAAVVLDDVAAERGMPDLVKLDIDGGEVDALHGAERILTERMPDLVIETHTAELERACGEILLGHGYAPRVVTQRRWLRDHRPSAHNRWLVASGRPRG